jgi:hypothetical protein
MDTGLHWVNLAVLFTTGLLPFPTAVMAEAIGASERLRAVVWAALFATAGVLGYLVAPDLALAIFIALPIFYAITSEGLDRLPSRKRRS